jgi:hypothetical protein
MPKVKIQKDDDWMKIFINDREVYVGHNASTHDWADVLQRAGVDVTLQHGQFGTVDEDGFHDGDDSTFTPDN